MTAPASPTGWHEEKNSHNNNNKNSSRKNNNRRTTTGAATTSAVAITSTVMAQPDWGIELSKNGWEFILNLNANLDPILFLFSVLLLSTLVKFVELFSPVLLY